MSLFESLHRFVIELIFYGTLAFFLPWPVTAVVFLAHWLYNAVSLRKSKEKGELQK